MLIETINRCLFAGRKGYEGGNRLIHASLYQSRLWDSNNFLFRNDFHASIPYKFVDMIFECNFIDAIQKYFNKY
jgi:hypothetical protein